MSSMGSTRTINFRGKVKKNFETLSDFVEVYLSKSKKPLKSKDAIHRTPKKKACSASTNFKKDANIAPT